MAAPEFLRLNGQAVRVTSWQEDANGDASTLVVIARGPADRDKMLALLKARPLILSLPDEPDRPVVTHNVDLRGTGSGQQAIYRIVASLAPTPTADPEETHPSHYATTPAPSVEDRLASIERRLDEIVALLRERRQDEPSR
jgi:hypothetical protein